MQGLQEQVRLMADLLTCLRRGNILTPTMALHAGTCPTALLQDPHAWQHLQERILDAAGAYPSL